MCEKCFFFRALFRCEKAVHGHIFFLAKSWELWNEARVFWGVDVLLSRCLFRFVAQGGASEEKTGQAIGGVPAANFLRSLNGFNLF